MAKKMKVTAQVFKAPPKRSENFKKLSSGECSIDFRNETDRYALTHKEQFIMSCQGFENVARYANEKFGTKFSY